MMKNRYVLLDIEEFPAICDFCHRKEIIVCYIVEDTESGDILRFGSVCIKKALGITQKEMIREVKEKARDIELAYSRILMPISMQMQNLRNEWREQNNLRVGCCPKEYKEYGKLEERADHIKSELKEKLKPYN